MNDSHAKRSWLGRKTTFGLSCLLVLVVAILMILTRAERRLEFSNGSWLIVRKVSYGTNNAYYHDALRRAFASTATGEKAWRLIRFQFPGLVRKLKITEVNSKVQGGSPSLVIFGDAHFTARSSQCWEIVAVDRDGKEHGPLETPGLDDYDSVAGNQPRIGPCVLALVYDLKSEPQFVRFYEVDRKTQTRKLLTNLDLNGRSRAVELSSLPSASLALPVKADDPQHTLSPRVVSVFPAEGAVEVDPATELRIRFDRPMNALTAKLDWNSSGFLDCDFPIYDADTCEFRIKVTLPEGTEHNVAINRSTRDFGFYFHRILHHADGFFSENGAAAAPFAWRFQTRAGPSYSTEKELAPSHRAHTQTAANDPRLLELLDRMREKRNGMNSLVERVQNLGLGQRNGLFVSMRALGARFMWEHPNRYYGEVAGIYSAPDFQIGCDGSNWWFQYQSDETNVLVACPADEMQIKNTSFCDPFGLTERTPEEAARSLDLIYGGCRKRSNAELHLIEGWNAQGERSQWWIDQESFHALEVVVQSANNSLHRTRFLYDSVNGPIPLQVFALPEGPTLKAKAPDVRDTSYTNGFVIIRDGSDGRIRLRWGKEGPKGTHSGGLN